MANGKELKLLDNSELVSLARYASEHGVSELEWCDGEARISLKLKPASRKFRGASTKGLKPNSLARKQSERRVSASFINRKTC